MRRLVLPSQKPLTFRVAFFLLGGIFLFSGDPGVAAHKTKGPFSSTEKILTWISNYRYDPQPGRLGAAVKAMSHHRLLRNTAKNGIYIGFIAGVLGTNQLRARKLVASMFPMPPQDQRVIVQAIAFSGLPDWKKILRDFVERMPAKRVLISHYLYDRNKLLSDLPFTQGPEVLDAHWGYYFATGLYEPVTRIIEAVQWSRETKNLQKLTIGSMAKWTLATNAARDKRLLDLCRQEIEVMPKDKRQPLYDVIRAAQSFETEAIREAALKAVEQLKRNPNGQARKWYSAANIGQTVLALGCVVASATGHAELGVPCVITGALSSAALKLWRTGAAATAQ